MLIRAEIRADNPISIRAFERAGFARTPERPVAEIIAMQRLRSGKRLDKQERE
jgi:RimJ/RimL family protein N-acetyltransferase